MDGSDVSAVLQEVGREGVTEGVGRDALVQASRHRGPSYGALRGAFVKVVTPQFVGAGITRELAGGKQPLPRPVSGRGPELSFERVGKRDAAVPGA